MLFTGPDLVNCVETTGAFTCIAVAEILGLRMTVDVFGSVVSAGLATMVFSAGAETVASSRRGIREAEYFMGITVYDLFEWEGNTYVYYGTGDQQTWGTIRVAMHPASLKKFLESYFPENVPMIRFDARKGEYIYPGAN